MSFRFEPSRQMINSRLVGQLTGWVHIVLLFVGASSYGQTTYYVSATGNDSNNGRSQSTPFQSLGKVNSLALQPGDSILFRRGDTFRGTLTVRRSGSAGRPIVFDAYGSGSKPVISGSIPVTNWTNQGNNIWQATCSSCVNAVTGLFKNSVSLPLGRYPNTDAPNKGNLYIRAHTEKYQIFSQEHLPDGVDWKGAEVVMRPVAWILDRAVVDAQYGDALNLFNYSNYYPRDGSEFFFQNHPATLDRNGEWCYVPASKRLLVYDSLGTINGQLLTATVSSRGVDLANVQYLSFRNLHISEILNTSLYGQNVSNLTVTNVDITNSGEDGITIQGSGNNFQLENSSLATIYNNGIWIDQYQTVTLRGNSIRRIGVVPGRGKSGDGQYNGIASMANQAVLIENNTIDSVGYNGITFRNNTTIRRNVIANHCFSKVDGGGIYAWNGNRTPMFNVNIESNIIYTKPIGNTPWIDYSIGIMLDDCSENVIIKGNTVFGHTQWGVFLHGSPNITFTDNTLFDNRVCQLVVYHNGGKCPIRGHTIKRNIMVSKTPTQLVGQYESNADDLQQYGRIDSNYYARPFNENAIIRGVVNSGQGGNFDLQTWYSFSGGHDSHSKGSPVTYREFRNEGAGGTNRINSTFDTSSDNWELVYSRYGNAEVAYDNSNKLDGGSLRVSFPNLSGQQGSYAQAVKRIGTITAGKTYVLRFDAVASTPVSIMIYLRQYGPPFKEFDRRYYLTFTPTRQSFELPFVVPESENDAIIMVQTDTEGPVFWLDNVRLQEDAPFTNNPDEFIKLLYNPTLKDSVVTIPGRFRDIDNNLLGSSILLKPFTSKVIFKDIQPASNAADLSLALYSNKRVLNINDEATLQLRVRNESDSLAELSRWTCRLPANLQFVTQAGQSYADNVLTGQVSRLAPRADTTFTLVVKPTQAGLFRVAAQITTATSPDPDSSPNSGMADGEDDTATAEFRVLGNSAGVFESPNPNQRALPAVSSNQPAPDPARADLSLRMVVSRRVVALGDTMRYTIYVDNRGGLTANSVQLQNQLPDALQVENSPSWTANGRLLSTSIGPVPAGESRSVSFIVRVTQPGYWINRAQVTSSDVADPDSTPGNGFANGEDDQVQVDGRTQQQ